MGIETNVLIGVIIASLLGLAAGILWPYANAWFRNTDPGFKFNWRMVAGRIIAGLITFLINASFLTQMQEFVELVYQRGWFGYVLTFLAVLASTFVGREVQKTPGSIQEYRSK